MRAAVAFLVTAREAPRMSRRSNERGLPKTDSLPPPRGLAQNNIGQARGIPYEVEMSVESSQLAHWLALARAGDDAARNRLFEACRSFVAVVAKVQLHRRLHAKVDPSDLVQQSLLEAHRGFVDFQGGTPQDWLAWLKQIVQHNAIDADKHYRGASRRDLRKERVLAGTDSCSSHAGWAAADPGPSPSQLAMNAERELRLAAAIEALPDDYQQVVLLRNLERLPFDEVAERMNRTRGACQMLWMRAVEQLRTQLKNDLSQNQMSQ